MTYPLLGTKIVLDEEKIIKENLYDLTKMYEFIDSIAYDCNLIKIDKYTYHCKGDKYDLSNVGLFFFHYLMKKEWFTKNVQEWTWISEKEGNESLIGDDMGIWE